METLKKLAINHPYYCADSNFFSSETSGTFETMTEFLDGFEKSDEDLNLCFRWDVYPPAEDGEPYHAMVYLILQRKGIFKPCEIRSVNEEEAVRFQRYALRHWKKLKDIWNPLSIRSGIIN